MLPFMAGEIMLSNQQIWASTYQRAKAPGRVIWWRTRNEKHKKEDEEAYVARSWMIQLEIYLYNCAYKL